jgi:hypothetical protein
MQQWLRQWGIALVAVAVLVSGATEAWAARGVLRERSCDPNYNWCAPSQGGQHNCDRCCDESLQLDLGGFCNSFAETEFQGCICYFG